LLDAIHPRALVASKAVISELEEKIFKLEERLQPTNIHKNLSFSQAASVFAKTFSAAVKRRLHL
jgi:hypothetical protein